MNMNKDTHVRRSPGRGNGSRAGGTRERRQASGGRQRDQELGYRFGYEKAFDPRFEGRRWADVESDLQAEFKAWAERQGRGAVDEDTWDRVKGNVREAWESS